LESPCDVSQVRVRGCDPHHELVDIVVCQARSFDSVQLHEDGRCEPSKPLVAVAAQCIGVFGDDKYGGGDDAIAVLPAADEFSDGAARGVLPEMPSASACSYRTDLRSALADASRIDHPVSMTTGPGGPTARGRLRVLLFVGIVILGALMVLLVVGFLTTRRVDENGAPIPAIVGIVDAIARTF